MNQPWSEFLQAQVAASEEFVRGNPVPYRELWSHRSDVSILGAFGGHEAGWKTVTARLDWASSQYGAGWSFADETIAQGVASISASGSASSASCGRTTG